MRFLSLTRLSILATLVFSFYSCQKKTEIFQTDALSDYIPLAAGKYITYRLDSTVFPNFGRATEIHSYEAKHVIESQITDNLGRPSYRVFCYLRDTAGTEPWVPSGSYFITPLSNQVELSEDNLRFIKLRLPIKDGITWKGNKYISANPYESLYSFSNDDNMEDWDYQFDGGSTSFSFGGKNYTDVYSIEEANEAYNIPIVDPNAYASKTRAVEKYSKNIGLVYKEYELWEYQPNPGGSGGPFKTGFGIKMWMIDHN
ncbi:MAG: hypothetical protein JJE22_01750 [Bacteroidia bacterium]|nr:hypothetical protein [Bacteroidia bacterium]